MIKIVSKNYYWLLLSAFIVVLDQFTKHLVLLHLVPYQPLKIFPLFNFMLAYNFGIAFSLFNQAGDLQHWLLIGIIFSIIVIIVLGMGLIQRSNLLKMIGISLILGGALGNFWDRLTLNYVVDFLDFYIKNYHWPTFNVADSSVCVGVFLLVVSLLVCPTGKPKNLYCGFRDSSGAPSE